MALLIGPLDDLIGDADAVGGEGEPEIFVVLLFDAAGVGHQLLADLKIHQRLAAEEVHLQIMPGAGMFHQKIQRPFAGLKAHQAGLAVELSLRRKAVGAVQIAGVRHVQAQRLDHIGAVLEVKGVAGVGVRGKELSLRRQLVDILKHIRHILRGGGIFFAQLRGNLLTRHSFFQQADGVIGQLVHRMDAAAVHVQHNVVAI